MLTSINIRRAVVDHVLRCSIVILTWCPLLSLHDWHGCCWRWTRTVLSCAQFGWDEASPTQLLGVTTDLPCGVCWTLSLESYCSGCRDVDDTKHLIRMDLERTHPPFHSSSSINSALSICPVACDVIYRSSVLEVLAKTSCLFRAVDLPMHVDWNVSSGWCSSPVSSLTWGLLMPLLAPGGASLLSQALIADPAADLPAPAAVYYDSSGVPLSAVLLDDPHSVIGGSWSMPTRRLMKKSTLANISWTCLWWIFAEIVF